MLPDPPLPYGYMKLNNAILTAMRRDWNRVSDPLDDEEWKTMRVRAGLRVHAAVVTYGVEWNKFLYKQMKRPGIWVDGLPYDAIRRPYFKASPVILDRSLHPLDYVVEHVA